MFFPLVSDKIFLVQMDVLTIDTCKWCFSIITQTFSDFSYTRCPSDSTWQHFPHQSPCFSSISSYLPLHFSLPFLFFSLYPDVFMAFILSDRARFSSNFNFIRSFIARHAMIRVSNVNLCPAQPLFAQVASVITDHN